MADPRHQPEQEDIHEVCLLLNPVATSRITTKPVQGAKPSELLIEAARRNNTDLLQEVITETGSPGKVATLLNETKTVMGNYLYHEAALRGNCVFLPLFCASYEQRNL